MKKVLAMLLAMAFSMSTFACDVRNADLAPAVHPASQKREFIVSGVLRKSSTDISIRLVHSLVVAGYADEAQGKFTRQVLNDFPGYSLATTLVTETVPVNSVSEVTCNNDVET